MKACTFHEKGGWVVDAAFTGRETRPALLAHGLGRPVRDAVATLRHPRRETLRLWVETRDWVAPQGPGRFKVVVNGEAHGPFGQGEGAWHWADGGLVDLREGENEIRLRDLTGFDGRVAELRFLPDGETPSPSCAERDLPAVWPSAQSFDLVVVGGGYAGLCAAVAAARKGVRTALVQDRPVWGGNASTEIRVGPIGGLDLPPFPQNSDLAYELLELTSVSDRAASGGLRPAFNDARLAAWLAHEPNLTTFVSTRVVATRIEASRIASVLCWNSVDDSFSALSARQFVDATGDAALATLSGAEVRTQPEDGETLKGGYGSTNFWTTRWTDRATPFPRCPWALDVTAENAQISEPRFAVEGDYPYAAGWNWESGFGRDAVRDAEAIRDLNFRAAYGMWDYLKNKSSDRARYANAEMDWMAFVPGKRAAVRVVGDYVLSERDLVESRSQPDGVVTTTWFLDLHAPHPQNARAFPGSSFRSIAYDDPNYAALVPEADRGRRVEIRPCAIPFRCFYSRTIGNLWTAGKDISYTHVAMSSVRVENTTAQMGAMVGRAASVCLREDWTPRELGRDHFDALCTALRDVAPSALARCGMRRAQGRTTLGGELAYWTRRVLKPRLGSLWSLLRKAVRR